MSSFPWLTTLGVVPLVGSAAVAVVAKEKSDAAKKIALTFSVATLGIGIAMATQFKKGGDRFQFTEKHQWIKAFNIDYGLGVFHRSAFDRVPDGQPFDLAALYRELHKENRLAAHEVLGRFYEVGSFNGILDFQSYLQQRQIA